MRWSEISESLSSPVPYTHRRNEDGVHFWEFTVGDGNFTVQANNRFGPSYWEFSFVRDGNFELTRTGNAQVVMSTVMDILRSFIREFSPRFIEVGALKTEGSRIPLYRRLMRLLVREFPNYEVEEKTRGKHHLFVAERPIEWKLPEPTPQPELEQPTPLTDEEWAELEDFINKSN